MINLHYFRKHDCAVIHDMISITKSLQEKLSKHNSLMQYLDPKFVLVGSTQEGSRIGVGNEMDLSMHFMGWGTPFKAWLPDGYSRIF